MCITAYVFIARFDFFVFACTWKKFLFNTFKYFIVEFNISVQISKEHIYRITFRYSASAILLILVESYSLLKVDVHLRAEKHE